MGCNYCNVPIYVKATKYAKSLLAPATEAEALRQGKFMCQFLKDIARSVEGLRKAVNDMVIHERGYCNWEYTGEYDTNKSGQVKKTEWKTDCGKLVNWTRDNAIGKLFKDYGNQIVPQGERFYVNCPYCGNELNLVNPYDDGETWRKGGDGDE